MHFDRVYTVTCYSGHCHRVYIVTCNGVHCVTQCTLTCHQVYCVYYVTLGHESHGLSLSHCDVTDVTVCVSVVTNLSPCHQTPTLPPTSRCALTVDPAGFKARRSPAAGSGFSQSRQICGMSETGGQPSLPDVRAPDNEGQP